MYRPSHGCVHGLNTAVYTVVYTCTGRVHGRVTEVYTDRVHGRVSLHDRVHGLYMAGLYPAVYNSAHVYTARQRPWTRPMCIAVHTTM